MRLILATLAAALTLALCPIDANAAPIREDGYVEIGGIQQWITIHGADANNPVVLMVHGGPGDPLSPFADSIYGSWQSAVTLVQWDQRGAGRTYGKSGEQPAEKMSIAQFVNDGTEVARYARNHLAQSRVILVCGSWGTILCLHMIREHPEYYSAYIANAQLVNMPAAYAETYARVLALATAAKDEQALAALTALGRPPWHAGRDFGAFGRIVRKFEEKSVTLPPAAWAITPDYAGKEDQANDDAGEDFSFGAFIGAKGDGELPNADLTSLGAKFDVPIYVVDGAEDLVAPPDLTREWFDKLSCPAKKFVLVPKAGHGPNAAIIDAMYAVLVGDVLHKTPE